MSNLKKSNRWIDELCKQKLDKHNEVNFEVTQEGHPKYSKTFCKQFRGFGHININTRKRGRLLRTGKDF